MDGQPNSQRAGATVARHERRQRIARHLAQNLTYREIAAIEGITIGTVCQDVKKLMEGFKADALRSIEEWVSLEVHKLNLREQAHAELAWAGDIESDKRLQAIAVRRAALLGLDAAAKQDVTLRADNESSLEARLSWMAENIRSGRDVLNGLNDEREEPIPEAEAGSSDDAGEPL